MKQIAKLLKKKNTSSFTLFYYLKIRQYIFHLLRYTIMKKFYDEKPIANST